MRKPVRGALQGCPSDGSAPRLHRRRRCFVFLLLWSVSAEVSPPPNRQTPQSPPRLHISHQWLRRTNYPPHFDRWRICQSSVLLHETIPHYDLRTQTLHREAECSSSARPYFSVSHMPASTALHVLLTPIHLSDCI